MDKGARKQLVDSLPLGVRPFVLPPISVSPARATSDELIHAMRRCDGVISLRGGQSELSFWVMFQRDYARRIGCPLYLYNPSRRTVEPWAQPPMSLRAFPMYTHRDAPVVAPVINYLLSERGFDVWPRRGPILLPDDAAPAPISLAYFPEIGEPLSCGLLFMSGLVSSPQALQAAITAFASRGRPTVVAGIAPGMRRPKHIAEDLYIDLVPSGRVDPRRVDDLMVRLYWAVLQESRLGP
jgi:hypothetical protein